MRKPGFSLLEARVTNMETEKTRIIPVMLELQIRV